MTRELFLYTRKQCDLCTHMHRELRDILTEDDVIIHLVDIEGDGELIHRYGARIPVLVAGNNEICELKLDRQALDSYLSSN